MSERPTTAGDHDDDGLPTADIPGGVPSAPLADRWGILLTYGIVVFVFGLVLAVWPEETVKVVAFVTAFQLIISGSVRMFVGMASASLHGWVRAAAVTAGFVAIVMGVACVVAPLQTLKSLGFLVGAALVVAGLADVAVSPVSRSRANQAGVLVGGLLTVAVGVFLVVNPERSLELLVVLLCAWLFGYGAITIMGALALRARSTTGSPTD